MTGAPQPLVIRRIGSLQLAAVGVGAAITLVIVFLPQLSFAYRGGDVQVALETAATVVAALTAFLLYQRFRRTRGAGELILLAAVLMITLANLATALGAVELDRDTLPERAVWVPLWAQLLASGTLALAAFAPRQPLLDDRRAIRLLALAMAALAAVALAALVLAPSMPTGIDPDISPAEADSPRVVGAAGMLACQLAAMALLGAASVGFTLRARETGDELLAWFSLAMTVGAFSRLNYFLFPSRHSDWVFAGDGFRLAVYLLLLVGALRQIGYFADQAADAAILEERQRMARDLHDGLAQELALIAMRARRLAGPTPEAEPIVEASRRALADSRAAIMELSRPLGEPFPTLLGRAAGALAEARGARASLDLDQTVELPPEAERSLLFILSEAISNAVAHGQASQITVRLSGNDGVTLVIADDGRGFDPDSVDPSEASHGRGIENMRERIARLGGELRVSSGGGRGTRIEVRLP